MKITKNHFSIFAVLTLVLIVVSYAVYSNYPRSHCRLEVDNPVTTQHTLGNVVFDAFDRHKLWVSASAGNVMDDVLYDRRSDNFNYDGLYRLSKDGKSWLFRYGGQVFDNDGTKRTFLYDVQWANGDYPKEAGAYTVEVVSQQPNSKTSPTLNTVGDSITWWQYGEYFRCLLADNGLPYNFVGSRTDIFGYGHDGEGGNNTRDVLNRIQAIPPSSYYFILIGTNDRFSTDETVSNIMKIAALLRDKQNDSIVLISTLLPRKDEFNARVEGVNEKLKNAFKHCKDCQGLKLIDTNVVLAQKDWQSLSADGLHPNKEGYKFLAKFIANKLQNLQQPVR